MSILKLVLSPFAREWWIGRTFLHQKGGNPAVPVYSPAAGLVVSLLVPEDAAALERSPDADLRRYSASSGPAGVRRFAARMNGEFAGITTYYFGEEYLRANGFYELDPSEAELADLFTAARFRGLGIAKAMIVFSQDWMHREGFHTLYAKVWHSNTPSSKAFRAAGWTDAAFFVRLYPHGGGRRWHMQWPRLVKRENGPLITREWDK